LVEPIVVDPEGGIIMGAEVLEASRRTGVSFDHVVMTDCSPEFYQEVRRRLVQARNASAPSWAAPSLCTCPTGASHDPVEPRRPVRLPDGRVLRLGEMTIENHREQTELAKRWVAWSKQMIDLSRRAADLLAASSANTLREIGTPEAAALDAELEELAEREPFRPHSLIETP
jgi:hypothetical protein